MNDEYNKCQKFSDVLTRFVGKARFCKGRRCGSDKMGIPFAANTPRTSKDSTNADE